MELQMSSKCFLELVEDHEVKRLFSGICKIHNWEWENYLLVAGLLESSEASDEKVWTEKSFSMVLALS